MISSLQFDEENAEWINGALEVFNRENNHTPEIRFPDILEIGKSVRLESFDRK